MTRLNKSSVYQWIGLVFVAFLLLSLNETASAQTGEPIVSSTNCDTVTEIPVSECQALVALYNSTDGPHWSDSPANNWNLTNTPCSWSGVGCEAGRVTQIGRLYVGMKGSIPPEIGNLTALQVLNLTGNELTSLPPEFGNLTALQHLELYGNQMTSMPPGFSNLTALQTLNLGVNQLTSLPSEIGNLTGLSNLQLGGNQLTSLPPEIGNLTGLSNLQLGGNQLTSLPPEFGNLTALQTLELRDNQLTSLPPEFGNLTALQKLDLAGTQLTSLPPEFGNLTALGWLDLSDAQLTSLPPEFGNLTVLDVLMLGGNQLTSLPPEFGNLTVLRYLILRNNQLTSLPPEFGNLSALQILYLGSNQLTSLPLEFYNLTALYELELGNNQLTSLPPEFGNLTALEGLDLGVNQLTSLPPEIGNLTGLSNLQLGGNQLTSLPSEFGNLTALGYLDLGGNQLTSLPPEFGNLPVLWWLGLSYNQLTSLPPEFGNLTALEYLYLSDNHLCSLPVALTNLNPSLGFTISDNRLTVTDPTLLAWLNSHQSDWAATQTPGLCSLTDLLSLHILQFDNSITSTVDLDTFYPETMQGLAQASLGYPEKTAIVLADRSGSTPDAIFKIHDGIVTHITAQWAGMTPEVDATDGVFLGNFVWWARAQYPAARTTLSVVGHGLYAAPEMGILPPSQGDARALNTSLFPLPLRIGGSSDWSDVNPQPGFFSIYDASEMARIGSNNGSAPLDVLDFSQCYGASVEQFYALRDYAQMLTGGANYVFYDPALPGAGLTALDPTQSPMQMASALISAYFNLIPSQGSPLHPRVLIAVDTQHLDYLKDRLDGLSSVLQSGLSNATTRADYRAGLLAAYTASLHYDTTSCSPQDWELCPPDAMVDVFTFALQLQSQFGALSPVGLTAGEVAGATQAAVITKMQQNGTPWFGSHAWDFTPGAGLSLYADFGGKPDPNSSGGVILNGISHWYNNTVSTDNPHPYALIATGAYGATWADVLHTYWNDAISITTELCISAFPNIQESGEVAALNVLFPLHGWAKVNTEVTPTVVFNTAYTLHNPQLALTITQNSEIVFSDTVYLGYRAPGAYTITTSHAWIPAREGAYTLRFIVDSQNQIIETNELDNDFLMSDFVQAAPPCPRPAITANIVNGQQWFSASPIALDLAQSGGACSPVTRVAARFYGFQPGANPSTQVPVHLGDQSLSLSLPQNNYPLTLPAGAQPGAIVVYLFPFSNLGGYGYPATVTFNYSPPQTPLSNGAEHFYRFTVHAGEQVSITCQANQGSAQVYVWEPGNPASALTRACDGNLSLDPTLAGEYIVSVKGLAANTTYTLTATRGSLPLLDPVHTVSGQFVHRERPTFVEPLPEIAPDKIIYLPLAVRSQSAP